MQMTHEHIGQRIKELRCRKGLSQEELARRIELPRTAVTKIEAGSQEVRFRELGKFAEALGISLGTLVEERRPVRQAEDAAFFSVSDCRAEYGAPSPLPNILLLVLSRTAGDPAAGTRRIAAIVAEADRLHDEAYGGALSGLEGSAPEAIEHAVAETLEEMAAAGELQRIPGGRTGALRYLPEREPDLEALTAAAYVTIEKAIAYTARR